MKLVGQPLARREDARFLTVGNAIVDALWHLGLRHIDPPYTPQAVWKALNEANG
jgi:hypothetical protein